MASRGRKTRASQASAFTGLPYLFLGLLLISFPDGRLHTRLEWVVAVGDRGLERALTSLAHHASVPVELHVALPGPRLARSVEAAAYFTVSEALTNVAKYARATRAWVDVERLEAHLGVEVGDDGAGGADLLPGCGLQGLRNRIAAVNGTLTVDSPRGAGTVIRARMPID